MLNHVLFSMPVRFFKALSVSVYHVLKADCVLFSGKNDKSEHESIFSTSTLKRNRHSSFFSSAIAVGRLDTINFRFELFYVMTNVFWLLSVSLCLCLLLYV